MRITAKEVLANWADHDPEAPYHTEQKPVGHDRKRVEGPFPTNEDFENTWMPTEKEEEECQPVAVEQVEIVQIQLAKRADVNSESPAGVPPAMYLSWERAHDLESDFAMSRTVQDLIRFVDNLYKLAESIQQYGTTMAPGQMEKLDNYVNQHPPDNREEGVYFGSTANEIVDQLDYVLSNLHTEAARVTGVDKGYWYEFQANQMQKARETAQPTAPIDPSVVQKPLSLSDLREVRGPGTGYLEELWKRKKKHEISGRTVRAIDVVRPQKPVIETEFEDDPTQQEQGEPPKPWKYNPDTVYEEISQEVAQVGDAETLAKLISDWSWEEQDEREGGVGGAMFSYNKTIYLRENFGSYDDRLEFFAFIEPLANRKKRLLDQAERIDSNTGRGGSMRAQEIREEAEGMPDVGYINDIEVFLNDELFFHRERSFGPKPGLPSGFMGGNAIQRAMVDLQQYIDTQLDPLTVGQFIERTLKTPGKGEARLSMRTAGDLLQFDPRKRQRPLLRKMLTDPSYRPVKLQEGQNWRDTVLNGLCPSDGTILKWGYWKTNPKLGEYSHWWCQKCKRVWGEDGMFKGREDTTPKMGPDPQRNKSWNTEGREAMKITAVDVLPFDPGKRKLKSLPPAKKPSPEPPTFWDDFSQETPAEESAIDEYQGYLYAWDQLGKDINDIAKGMVRLQPGLPPREQKEAGAIIAKLKAALRALSS